MSFDLTVPGTDTPLREVNDRLVADGHEFGSATEGIWDLVRPHRRAILDVFAADYAAVRTAEHRELTAAEVQTLPVVHESHPNADMWQQRAESHRRFKKAIASRGVGTAVDIGSGCGWLSADLARSGWQAAAIDVTVEGGDGLAAARYHNTELLLARAEMQALPFASDSVDLAVFNASLHYAANIDRALREACRVVRPGGSLVVFDSPVFTDIDAGQQMVDEFAAHCEETLGVPAAKHEGPGFISSADLHPFDFSETHHSSGLRRRIHAWLGARQAGRQTASRPLLVATIGDTT